MLQRDFGLFPDDENGEVLWRMHSSGDDLCKTREIDFSVVFPSEKQALAFCVVILKAGHKVALAQFPDQPDGSTWDVTVSSQMIPTHPHISEFEQFLAERAQSFGGVNDGWGCFSQS